MGAGKTQASAATRAVPVVRCVRAAGPSQGLRAAGADGRCRRPQAEADRVSTAARAAVNVTTKLAIGLRSSDSAKTSSCWRGSELDALRDRLYVLECAIGDVERDLAAGLDPTELREALVWLLEAARPLVDV